MANKSLVIMPTYNEKENLQGIVSEILETVSGINVLIIDDNSPDGTGEIADLLAKAHPEVGVIHRAGKLGLGTAYIMGFKHALKQDYQTIFEMDADFSHDPAMLPIFLKKMDDGYDLVIGSRYVEGGGTEHWGWHRKLISKGGSLYARTILGVGIKDLTTGFKCFSRGALESIDLDSVKSEGYSFQIELTYKALKRNLKVLEIPIIFSDRAQGKSKMSRRIFLEALWKVWAIRFSKTP